MKYVVQLTDERHTVSIEPDGVQYENEPMARRELSAANAAPTGPAPIIAPMPGLIVRVNVSVGDRVEAGQGIVVMEAMKMENELRATAAGTVWSINVTSGTAVEKGALLVELD